ncbi:MAG: hypothetical protein V1853_01355 [bacterium]
MKNKPLFLFIALVGIFGATLLVANATSAAGLLGFGHGGEQKLQTTAEILGTDAETLKQELETKDLPKILEDNGVTQDEFQAQMQEKKRAMLKAEGLTDEKIGEMFAQHEERHQAMLENKAEILGMSTEELEKALEDQSWPELPDEAGVTHVELHEKMSKLKDEFGGKGFGHGPPGGFDKT